MAGGDTNPWWWLSFADGSKPKGSQFLGAVIIRGSDFINAVRNAHLYGVNPGGEVRGKDIPDDLDVPEWARRRLLTKAECELVDRLFMRQLVRRAVTEEDRVECPECHDGTVVLDGNNLRCTGCDQVFEVPDEE